MNKLSIVLWNTKLSPPMSSKWNKSEDSQKIQVAKVIQLFISLEYDFICLSEVSPEDIEFMYKALQIESFGYSFKYKEQHEKSIYYDTAIFFKNKFLCIDMRWGIDGERRHVIKAYQYYDFIEYESGEKFSFYLTHLPSKLAENSEKRRSITSYIRQNLSIRKDEDNDRKFIVLGDFNTEPFSPEMINGLRSSRHQQIVRDDPHLLYNPCWKFLPCNDNNPIGTFYYARGEYNYWQVIDQILFSGNFLSDGWQIKDANIDILDVEKLINDHFSLEFENPSDHRPIHAILEK
ncbi:endonuclease/exonuclease/phosphatase family protein [Acinetobacter pollinis]|uniref:endonuclease/exonuclease/phosphatase family protein n=1 Tax=Acinetobacter pollinis TaxID=2605270 RepID=UPI0018A3285F|nr:endonuclease/exonuclease/phosphatase family protein [Acinetobacter pollinis]MBF7690853.1 endonuclease/exonuclease/phosphatase family protein [Acinetobacter pollinis]MBF7698498.1 endonuclease/exonuclease/phosphatase family protein [Acinetobacter pollinis]